MTKRDPESLLPLNPGDVQLMVAWPTARVTGYAIMKGSRAVHRRRSADEQRHAYGIIKTSAERG